MKHALVGLLVAMLVPGILLAPVGAAAQPPAKVPRVGYLSADSSAAARHQVEAFRQGLRDHGYVEGQSIIIEYRFAEGSTTDSTISPPSSSVAMWT